MADVAAVVVNFNAGDHLIECVRSLRRAGVADVIVVNNASSDDSIAQLAADDPATTVVEAGANLGYGGGVNRGLRVVANEHVLVLNPDVTVEPAAGGDLVAALDADGRVGIVGPRIDEVDGTRYPSAREFPHLIDAIGHAFVGLVSTDNRFSRRYLMGGSDDLPAQDVDWVSGACFLARRAALTDVGGFDEAFFMYLEEVDLCWRVGRAGWRIRYEPAARVTHVQGVSTAQAPYRMLAHHHRSLLRFWWRSTAWPGRLLAPAVLLGLALRFVVMATRRAVQGRGSH